MRTGLSIKQFFLAKTLTANERECVYKANETSIRYSKSLPTNTAVMFFYVVMYPNNAYIIIFHIYNGEKFSFNPMAITSIQTRTKTKTKKENKKESTTCRH